jgi:hypothetical protein
MEEAEKAAAVDEIAPPVESKKREPPTVAARVSLEDMVHYYVERILQTRSDRIEYYKSLTVRLRFSCLTARVPLESLHCRKSHLNSHD